MNRIRVLQFGKKDWNQVYKIPDFVELSFFEDCKDSLKGIYDLLFLDYDLENDAQVNLLCQSVRAYCVYITENVELSEFTRKLTDSKTTGRIYTGDLETFFQQDVGSYFTEPYGERFKREFLSANPLFKGSIDYHGSYDLSLEGDFGTEYAQVAYWKMTIPFAKDQSLDLYLEYETEGEVEIQLVLRLFKGGSVSTVQKEWVFKKRELEDVIRISNTLERGTLYASIHAKGNGKLSIISLHDRYSRGDIGFFLPGGERYVTSKGEEIFCYFDPADLKPPLAVYFSGYRSKEGFEGYYMMRELGCPFLLITDPRQEGGAFYLGDSEYEKLMVRLLEGYMKRMRFDRSQVIMSGSAMGTFGAMYYGCDIKPCALILGKPIANLGNVAKNETLGRVGGFPAALDILKKNYGDLTDESVEAMNHRFWDKFDGSNFENTRFIVSYLYEDDYDAEGYQDLLEHLNYAGVKMYGKGMHGHHNDNTKQVIAWFKAQYSSFLKSEFGRED